MSELIALDMDILARSLLNDIPDHAIRARRLLHSAANGEVALFVATTVFIELSHPLHRRRSIPRQRVATTLLALLRLPGLHIQDREPIGRARGFRDPLAGCPSSTAVTSRSPGIWA